LILKIFKNSEVEVFYSKNFKEYKSEFINRIILLYCASLKELSYGMVSFFAIDFSICFKKGQKKEKERTKEKEKKSYHEIEYIQNNCENKSQLGSCIGIEI
jgi:hypothetical protein